MMPSVPAGKMQFSICYTTRLVAGNVSARTDSVYLACFDSLKPGRIVVGVICRAGKRRPNRAML